jgi:hypothetical protein
LAQHLILRSWKKRKQSNLPYWPSDKDFPYIQYPTRNAGFLPAFLIIEVQTGKIWLE